MSQDLKLHIKLKAIDKLTRPLRGVIKTAEKMRSQMSATGGELKKLQQTQSTINTFKSLRMELNSSSQTLTDKREATRQLQHRLTATKNPTQKLRNAFLKARNAAAKAEQTYSNKRQKLASLQTQLKQSGVNTRQLATAENQLSANISKVNRRLQTQATRLDGIRKKTAAAAKMKTKKRIQNKLKLYANTRVVGAAGYTAVAVEL